MNAARCTPHRAARQACLVALGLAASGSGPAVCAAEGRSRQDLAAFSLITERNIFNASRAGGRTATPRETRRPARVDAFGLVGVMSYDKGTFAFFDGSGPDYRKALQTGGDIAGFQLVAIFPAAVTLQNGTNSPALEMRLGMQMRREEEGEWKMGERTETFDSAGGSRRSSTGGRGEGPSLGSLSTGSTTGGGSADEADALERLRKRREQENQ